MLTTDDKIKSTALDKSGKKRKVFFGFREYFITSYPVKHLVSLFFNYSLKKELIEFKNGKKNKKNDHNHKLSMCNQSYLNNTGFIIVLLISEGKINTYYILYFFFTHF